MLLTMEELAGIPVGFCAQLPKEHAITEQALVRRAVLNTSQHTSACALPKIQRLLLINQPQQKSASIMGVSCQFLFNREHLLGILWV